MRHPEDADQAARRRAFWVLGAFAVLYAALALRVVYLHVVRGPELAHRAERQHEKSVAVEAERGTIYDRNGRVLATDLTVPSLYAAPPLIDNPESIARELAAMLRVDAKPLARRLAEDRGFIWLERRVDPAVARAVEELGAEGVRVVPEPSRVYPRKTLLSHVLGFAGTDHVGLEGVERFYDRDLRGETGRIIYERDGAGKRLFPKGLEYVAPSRGHDLVLTIDEGIQHISERELDAAMSETGAESGTVVVMDPWDGGVLALAVRPEFNPNEPNVSRPEAWRNRAITDTFEPGSTFKIVTAAAALDAGLVRPDEIIDCEQGRWPITGGVLHDHEPLGRVPFSEVVAKSSNIGTAKIAQRLGPERLRRAITDFGFGRKTGIDLGGEAAGRVAPLARWSKRTAVTMAIGQELMVTTMQLAVAYAAVANGGRLVTPHVVAHVRGADGLDAAGAASPGNRVMSERTAGVMARLLEGVVGEDGTGALAVVEGIRVAGKTGTAQQVDPETGRYSADRETASFIGFAPSTRPAVVIAVVLDNPSGRGWGGRAAAPVFSRVAAGAVHYLSTPAATPAPQDGVLRVALR
ncbi:MAG TPA: penicillin-binding protein 2 [Nitrospiria bacterium]|nr:penicillin-binding protein 2 [Nitrospiria bacterium]